MIFVYIFLQADFWGRTGRVKINRSGERTEVAIVIKRLDSSFFLLDSATNGVPSVRFMSKISTEVDTVTLISPNKQIVLNRILWATGPQMVGCCGPMVGKGLGIEPTAKTKRFISTKSSGKVGR